LGYKEGYQIKILIEQRNGSRTGEKLLRVLEINNTIYDITCAECITFKETECAIYKKTDSCFEGTLRDSPIVHRSPDP